MLRALVGLVLAIGILGAAFASQYRDEANNQHRSWRDGLLGPRASPRTRPRSKVRRSRRWCDWLLWMSRRRCPRRRPARTTESAPKPDASRLTLQDLTLKSRRDRAGPSSSDLAQSLKTITGELASINGKLEQLKSRNEQTPARAGRHHSTAQGGAGEGCGGQCAPRRAGPGAANATDGFTRIGIRETRRAQRGQRDRCAAHGRTCKQPHRGGPGRRREAPWMPPPYMVDPYGDPDW